MASIIYLPRFFDCELVVNSGTLTYMKEENSDLMALTPAMFLHDVCSEGVS